ncbi:YccT family protein [Shewanella sp. A14]
MRSLIALLCFSLSQACMAASLQLPSNAETVLVNGKATQQSNVTLDLTMPNAIQQIAFRYQARYRDNGSQIHFTSDIVILRFQATEQHYRLTLPTINSTSRANQFNAHPAITLTDNAGNKVAFNQDKLMKSGLQIGRNFEQEISHYNASGAIAAITVKPTVIPTPNTLITNTPTFSAEVKAEQVDKSQETSQAEVSRMLDYWYQKANTHTQAKFKAKINQ